MFRKILDFIKKTDRDAVVPLGSEYELLIKNNRIIDYSHAQEKYGFDLKVGIYHDTYRFITAGFNTDTQKINIDRLLSVTSEAYRLMLKKNYHVKSTQEFLDQIDSKDYQRVQQLFEVDGIKLPQAMTSDTFCINFMLRKSATSYLVVGKKPKGRITRAERIEAVKNHARKWEEFKHL